MEKVIPGRLVGTRRRRDVERGNNQKVLTEIERDRSLRTIILRPEIRRDYPLNLSISLSGGKETNQDSPSNGE